MAEHVTIVGGGLAGLTLGIGLRQQDVPVTVWEAGQYPRHRVCGEFVSGRGLATLDRLRLRPLLQAAGATTAVSTAFFADKSIFPTRPLPEPALCLSRHATDALLAREFERLGGQLRSGERWTDGFGAGIVRASGRRVAAVADGWRLFGLKVHARNVALTADLEMHLLPTGYVGLCQLADGEVNICGLFRSETTVPDLAQRWREWLCGPVGYPLHTRLANARFDEASFCSIAGLSLRPRQAANLDGCSIGDALTMIPPVTGNGMSMAFESAELAIGPLVEFSRGTLSWDETRRQIARQCDAHFARRLRWAGWLQKALLQPGWRAMLFPLAAHSEKLWQELFRRTR